ncbi:uncharacterized protein KGF55_003444 [Candida pseudojiufengensis]|uniref:uncharacterized protein n=1 Tax=Candida pseudojiufengensis TaxID=497109 RepID=UPI002224A830|nr:uncharacterized protein KGF55_003444 [Candida pseudojiufengensis]KAI5962368.1 hypothetical protein KGF55_003444 [Candida pseudojiufengensis]
MSEFNLQSTIQSTISFLKNQFITWYGLIFISISLYFIILYIKRVIFRKKHGCEEPPIYPDGGFLGIKLGYDLQYYKKTGELIDFPLKLYKKYGNIPTFSAYLFGVRVVVTIEPENLKALLATQFNDFSLGTRHAHFAPLLGDGIFTLDGNGWKDSRAMLRPQFAREQIAHVQIIEPHLQILKKHILKNKGKVFDIQELFFRLTVDTSTEFLFGESVHSLYDDSIGLKCDDQVAGFAEAFNEAQKSLAVRTYLQVLYFLYNPPSFWKNTKIVHNFAKTFVNKALSLTPEQLEKQEGYTFLYELVKHTRNPIVLQDQLLNILVAGRDTTAGLLSFCFFELSRHPEIWSKLKEEIYSNFGYGDNINLESITFETLKKCNYLKWVLNETLRLYPSVPINFRVATKDTTLPVGGGKNGQSPVFVGKGTTVAYSPYVLQRMENYYGKDAEEFKPERWENLGKLGWAYLPFNGGPRICLGQQFALTEASYVIVRLTQMFPNLISGDSSPDPCRKLIHLTMSHMDGVFIKMDEKE